MRNETDIKNVYVYTTNALPREAKTSRTYTGYKNRKYYEEIIEYERSDSKQVYSNKRDAFNSYAKTKYNEVINFAVNAGLDTVSKGVWSLTDLGINLISSAVPSSTFVTHRSNLCVDFFEKTTWIYEGTNIFMGSRVTTGSYYFQDTVQEGYWATKQEIETPTRFYRTPNYDSPDVLAYQSYLSGGWAEFPKNIVHFNVEFYTY